ncbi:MAG: histidinol-phosphatase HisJ family protein [Oscillospiraceae bacterium]
MNFIDCHSHSDCSFDAHNSVKAMFNKACKKQLVAYAITDHFESYLNDEQNNIDRIISSCAQIDECKKIESKTKLIKGVEIGQPLQDIESVNNLFSHCDFDFVLGSIHNATNEDDFFYIDYKSITPCEMGKILEQYFMDVYAMAVWNKIDILAHLTYPYRYIRNSHRTELVIKSALFDDIINETFKVLIKNGKGIEVNTSGLFQEIGQTLPGLKYIKLFKELGGEVISVGSDSHCVKQVARGIKRATLLVQDVGFKYVTYFENRKPIMIKIN